MLGQATPESRGIIRMAGKLDRHGRCGEAREEWVSDPLPDNFEILENLSALANPDANLALIMQGGETINAKLKRPGMQVPGW